MLIQNVRLFEVKYVTYTPSGLWVPTLTASPQYNLTPPIPLMAPWCPWHSLGAPSAPLCHLYPSGPEYLHSLPAPNTPLTPPTSPDAPFQPQLPLIPTITPRNPNAPLWHIYIFWPLNTYPLCQPPIHPWPPYTPGFPNAPNTPSPPRSPPMLWYPLVFNCHHCATDHLHEYVQFTIYHLEVSRVHLHCCEVQPISAVSPKIWTLKLKLLCNTY